MHGQLDPPYRPNKLFLHMISCHTELFGAGCAALHSVLWCFENNRMYFHIALHAALCEDMATDMLCHRV